MTLDRQRLEAAHAKAVGELLAARVAGGHWEGELSSSALSTATAVTALAVADRESQIANRKSQITSGLDWLAHHANADGGWGDTLRSKSNLSTTILCWAAFGAVAGADDQFRSTVSGAERWLTQYAGGIDSDRLALAIIARYGEDRTFSVPILTMCALTGRLGPGRDAWRHVIPLPFELAAFPRSWFAALHLPVVSYALPALIAIGQARHVHRPSANPLARWLRGLAREQTLQVLTEIQPVNGGFLEATPLTSFVAMSLAGSGQENHPVTRRGLEFLLKSQRADGSWPIDTNLATWLTTLSVNALEGEENSESRTQYSELLRSWLLGQQFRVQHPYTGAAPGGWAWTDLPGGVPDADDTAGALLALRYLDKAAGQSSLAAAVAGIRWLLDLQNRDGGIPTFCRGWGALPFDRSAPDLTAHALRAWLTWSGQMPADVQQRMRPAIRRALDYLSIMQDKDGAWLPLWFGNEFARGEQNPVYGTSRVLLALAEMRSINEKRNFDEGVIVLADGMQRRGLQWLIGAQNPDGSWAGDRGGPSSVEETALAIEALAAGAGSRAFSEFGGEQSLSLGVNWLVEKVESGRWREPSPIGFYFAKLWYFEKLYPQIFTVAALTRVRWLLQPGWRTVTS